MYFDTSLPAGKDYFIGMLPRGDVNQDGVVDMEDYNLVRKNAYAQIMLTPEQKVEADVNLDGAADAFDASPISIWVKYPLRLTKKVSPQKVTIKDQKNKDISLEMYLTTDEVSNSEKGTEGKAHICVIHGAEVELANDSIDWTQDIPSQLKVKNVDGKKLTVITSVHGEIYIDQAH